MKKDEGIFKEKGAGFSVCDRHDSDILLSKLISCFISGLMCAA